VCAFIASSLFAQISFIPLPAVSLYQLSHKPSKQGRRIFHRANVQLKQRHYQVSVNLLEQALALDPGYWGAVNNLGYTYLKLEQQEVAEHTFEQAIQLDPENSIGYVNLSVAALNQQDYCVAENAARTALRLNPQLSEAKALLSLAQVGQGIWTHEGR
jgi:tetratricopeptide (TPR) repeat protein